MAFHQYEVVVGQIIMALALAVVLRRELCGEGGAEPGGSDQQVLRFVLEVVTGDVENGDCFACDASSLGSTQSHCMEWKMDRFDSTRYLPVIVGANIPRYPAIWIAARNGTLLMLKETKISAWPCSTTLIPE
jgi:hypothetical protein